MKPSLKLLMAFMVLVMLSLTSCGKDEPSNPVEPNPPGQNGGQSNESNESVEEIVANNVNASCTYNDFTFTFTISSTLNDKLPADIINYGIGHATTSFSEEISVSVGNQAYYYSSSKKGMSRP